MCVINPSSPSSFVKKKKGKRAGNMFVAQTIIPFKLASIDTSGIATKHISNNSKNIDNVIVVLFIFIAWYLKIDVI